MSFFTCITRAYIEVDNTKHINYNDLVFFCDMDNHRVEELPYYINQLRIKDSVKNLDGMLDITNTRTLIPLYFSILDDLYYFYSRGERPYKEIKFSCNKIIDNHRFICRVITYYSDGTLIGSKYISSLAPDLTFVQE